MHEIGGIGAIWENHKTVGGVDYLQLLLHQSLKNIINEEMVMWKIIIFIDSVSLEFINKA